MSEDDGIIGYHYLFAFSGDTPSLALRPVVVVASRGQVGDWAAYIAGVQGLGETTPAVQRMVRSEGHKLTESQARGFFPYVEGEYRP